MHSFQTKWSPVGTLLLLCGTVLSTAALAAAPATDLPIELTLEELVNIQVTSVSKRATDLSQSPAAISVITAEEIQRSGLGSLPETLRLAPGLTVARINSNEWAISSRGFNNQYASKLLVLVDGRSIYSPMFGGVYWNAQDIMLENIDRIEVIRGPGAVLWGANAVNGVINIISKTAKETQGGLLTAVYGTEEQPSISVRYGGQLQDDLHYRVYAKHSNRQGYVDNANGDAPDDWDTTRGGIRLDWEPSEMDTLTFQGEYYEATVGEYFERVRLEPPFLEGEVLHHDNHGGHLLGRWTHNVSDTSTLTLQTYYDRFRQGDGDVLERRDTFDLDLQHQFLLGQSHNIVWGGGFRYTSDQLPPSFYLTFTPREQTEHLYNLFIHDEITLIPERLALTLGSKIEHHDHTGFEVQPSARLLWSPTDQSALWASISRAVRTPARFDRGSRLNSAVSATESGMPLLVALVADSSAVSETLIAYELGYRIEPTSNISLDLAGYYNVYEDIFAYVQGPLVVESEPAPEHLYLPLLYENIVSGESFGIEASADWRVTRQWRISASYTWAHMRLRPDETSERANPRHQFQIRSYLDLSTQLQFNSALYYVGKIETTRDNDYVPIDAYMRLDLGLSWSPVPNLTLEIWGQNLLDERHTEFGSFKTQTLTEIPRGVRGKITWTF